MPVYTTNHGADAYGYCLGLLLLDGRQPFVPGDVGNASSFDFPVLYRTVPGSGGSRVLYGDPELNDAVVETARELQAQGVKGISSDCGFFIHYQDVVREAVDTPVALSSLLQLPFLSSFIGRDRPIGVITASTRALGNRVLELSGIEPDRRIVLRGMQDEPYWIEALKDPGDVVDTDRIEALVVEKARELVEEAPDMGAIVLECSMMPPYAKAVHDATGLLVFDFMTLMNFVQRATHQRAYQGYY
jgi:hypothetical protein